MQVIDNLNMNRINDYQNNLNWKHSLGEKLNKIHFRNGHLHAECDPITGNCSTHYDENDPYESLTELAKHVWKSDLGKVAVVGAGILLIAAALKSK